MNVIPELLYLVPLCVLSYFILCRLFDVDKLTRDQLARYNKELEHQRLWFECNAVPSNHQYEKMAEQAVKEGKTQLDNPFPQGTRDYDRWLCAYWDSAYRMGEKAATHPKAEIIKTEYKDRRYFVYSGKQSGKRFKQYSDYPIGTKAHALGGGCWIKIERGWKWATSGCVFPTPGADVLRIELPNKETK